MTEKGNARDRLLSSVGIRPDEVTLAGWMAILFMVTQASHAVGANAADTMFFLRYGVEDLPLMILLSGPAVMVAIVGHSAGLAWRGADTWLMIVMALSAAWVGLLRAGILTGSAGIYPVIWISTQVLIFLTLTVMWNAAGSACTTRQAKRLFPVFATAAVAGGVIGNLLVGPLTTLFGAENLLLVQGLLLVIATFLVVRVRSFFTSGSGEREPVRVEMTRAFSSIRNSRLLGLAAGVVFLLFALFYLVVFPFSEIVTATFPAETEMAGFLGLFSSVATAATFLFSLLATGRLFSRLGLIVTLITVPVVYLLGFSTWLVAFGILTAVLFRGLQWVAVNSVQTTAYSALFNVLSTRRRGPVLALMTAVPAQLGTMAAGAILLLGADGLSQAGLFWVGALLAAAAVGLVAAMRPAYLAAVVEAVRRGLVTVWDSPHTGVVVTPVDRDVVRILESHLSDHRPRARAIAAAGLGSLGDDSVLAGVEVLLDDDDPLVRSAAFTAVCQIEPAALEPRLEAAIADESPEVRLNAVRYLDSIGERDLPVAALATVLDDPDPRVRAAGAWLAPEEAGSPVAVDMVTSGRPDAVRAVFEEMLRHPGQTLGLRPRDFVADDDPAVRAAAAAAIAASGSDLEAVLPSLDDRSVRVRRAAARALASSHEGRELLLDVLEGGSVIATEAALDAMTPVEDLDQRFTAWAASEAQRASYLAGHRRLLETRLDSPQGRYLVRVLDSRVNRLVHWVLMAMTTDATKEIMPLVARGVEADDPETNAQAIEALESVADRSVLSVLLPLLEQSGEGAGSDAHEDTLRELSGDFDPWLSRLATLCLDRYASGNDDLASLGEMAGQELDTLDDMGRVLVLQQVPMFSGLDPEDLILVARFTKEARFDPNDPIYREGDPGTELLVIVEGSAVVSRTRAEARHLIDTYHAGEHVGELSLLTGGRRSADVEAGSDGLHGLVLGKSELMAILEERPAVALGMLGTLASRLIEQT
ncbi:MAG TPA: HEAT repeat domain-containing protein [Acidimicrobiia bacterium]